MEVASPGQGVNGHSPQTATSTIDPDVVVRHLVDLLELTLGASTGDLEAKGCLLSDAKRHDTVQRCTRFASESQVVLYVQKDLPSLGGPSGMLNGHESSGIITLSLLVCNPAETLSRSHALLYLFPIHGDFFRAHYRFVRCPH